MPPDHSTIRAFCAASLLLVGCPDEGPSYPEGPAPRPQPQPPDDVLRATYVHAMAPAQLEGSAESIECYSFTVDNDAPMYVEAVHFQNAGSLHHSNWFVVPEDVYPGEDGYWGCAEREFDEISAALAGTVLFAQSTQAQSETQQFADDVVIRIPARSKIVADVHLLNLGPDPRQTAGWLSLDVVHPDVVRGVLSPIMLSYLDLHIPPMGESRFTGVCGFESLSEALPISLYYVLPHFHGTGNYFSMKYLDYQGKETTILEREGFDASSLGETFDPPIDLELAGSLSFSCGYNNWYDQELTWGIGINEMCVVLGLGLSSRVLVGGVEFGASLLTDVQDDVEFYGAPCSAATAFKGRAYDMPTREERSAPLMLPPGDPEMPMPPGCVDRAGVQAQPSAEPTSVLVRERVFGPWCSFSSCHGDASAAGLRLDGDNVGERLVGVQPLADTAAPLVAPGDPEGSFLFQLISQCQPRDDSGAFLRHMPANAPTLLDDELVGLVRRWIEAGAPD